MNKGKKRSSVGKIHGVDAAIYGQLFCIWERMSQKERDAMEQKIIGNAQVFRTQWEKEHAENLIFFEKMEKWREDREKRKAENK